MPDAHRFAAAWITAWNERDVERVLAHFAESVTFRSPTAAAVVPDSKGVIVGKDALRSYWTAALARVPDLHFELDGVFAGIDTITLVYRNQRQQRVTETMVFRDQLVEFATVAHEHD